MRIDRRRKLPVTTLLYALDSDYTEQKRLEAQKAGQEIEASDVMGMSKEEVKAQYFDGTDHWLTAQEALQMGLIEARRHTVHVKTYVCIALADGVVDGYTAEHVAAVRVDADVYTLALLGAGCQLGGYLPAMQCKITVKRSESERVKSMMTSCGVMMPA